MDPEREVGERFELVVAGCYHLLTPFTAVAEQRCIIAHQNNHRDAVAELREDLLDEPRVRSWKAMLMPANGSLLAGARPSASLRCVYGLGSFKEF